MNKGELLMRTVTGEKTFEYIYIVENGKEELQKYEKKIDSICDNGFKTLGYGYTLPFNYFCRWRMQSWSSNSYRYSIFLLSEENIEEYIPEIKGIISEKIKYEIKQLEESLKMVSQ